MRKSFAALSVLLFAAAAPSAATAQTFEELNANSIKFVKGAFINLVLPAPLAANMEDGKASPKKAKRAKKRGKKSAMRKKK